MNSQTKIIELKSYFFQYITSIRNNCGKQCSKHIPLFVVFDETRIKLPDDMKKLFSQTLKNKIYYHVTYDRHKTRLLISSIIKSFFLFEEKRADLFEVLISHH